MEMDLSCAEEMLPVGDTPTPGPLFPPSASTVPAGQLLPANFRIRGSIPQQMDIFDVDEILTHLLVNDTYQRPDPDYFQFQTEINRKMRQTVTAWMYEICQEEDFMFVFTRAAGIMDRFLSVHKIDRGTFQLLGATCLLLSVKWTGYHLPIERLVYYTARSCDPQMIRDWEWVVMMELSYDVFCSTPDEFIEPLLYKLPPVIPREIFIKELIKYMEFCSIDSVCAVQKPSLIAGACFAVVLKKSRRLSQEVVESVLSQLEALIKVPVELMKELAGEIKIKYEQYAEENHLGPGQGPGKFRRRQPIKLEQVEPMEEDEGAIFEKWLSMDDLDPADSPTDVRDVDF